MFPSGGVGWGYVSLGWGWWDVSRWWGWGGGGVFPSGGGGVFPAGGGGGMFPAGGGGGGGVFLPSSLHYVDVSLLLTASAIFLFYSVCVSVDLSRSGSGEGINHCHLLSLILKTRYFSLSPRHPSEFKTHSIHKSAERSGARQQSDSNICLHVYK